VLWAAGDYPAVPRSWSRRSGRGGTGLRSAGGAQCSGCVALTPSTPFAYPQVVSRRFA